jgi:hypothetical protein
VEEITQTNGGISPRSIENKQRMVEQIKKFWEMMNGGGGFQPPREDPEDYPHWNDE